MKKLIGKSKTAKAAKIAAPIGSAEYGAFMKTAYMDTVDEVVVLSEDLEESLLRHDDIVETISKLKSEKDIIEHTIMALMKENETAYVKERKITWKKSTRCSIDSKCLKEEEPEIYDKYCKVSSNRIFKIK